jgi:hypothetical protein
MLQGVSATGLETKFCRFEEGVCLTSAPMGPNSGI